MATRTQNRSSRKRPAQKTAAKRSASEPAARGAAKTEAIAQLTQDHARVKKMFKQYDTLVKADAEDNEKQDLAATICTELTAHATAEEEIFYPAARRVLDEPDLIDEADVEHASART